MNARSSSQRPVYLSTQAQETLNRQPKTDAFVWSNPRTNSGHVRIDVVINDRMLNHLNAGVYETYNQESYDLPAKEWWQKWGDHIEELKQ